MGTSFADTLQTILIIAQILTCPILIILILLQSGKADDLGSALGGGGSGSSTVLGTGGASKFLVRATVFFAVLFMFNSITLAYLYKKSLTRSVTEGLDEPITPFGMELDDLEGFDPESLEDSQILDSEIPE